MIDIAQNLDIIRKSIEESALKAGRNPEDILLLGVTKTVDCDVILQAIAAGITDVGENKPQELKRKYEIIKDQVRWHQIGSLQTNKVKYIIDKVSLIHSLDRESLAEEINRQAEKHDITVNCLVQVNLSGEETKHGLKYGDVENFIVNCSKKYDRIKITGLMTMAAADSTDDETREVFRNLKKLGSEIARLNLENVDMKELSMGMSGDYRIAIEEGATIVRIGTSIFGRRNYNNQL